MRHASAAPLPRVCAAAIALAIAFAALIGLSACSHNAASEDSDANGEASAEPVVANVAALKGPTAMGMVKYMADVDAAAAAGDAADSDTADAATAADTAAPDVAASSRDVVSPRFSIYASADEITPKLVQGELDIAAVPANLASVLWNNTDGAVQVIAVNTLGVLYICEQGDTVHSVSDLAGRTIYAAGKGSTPEYALDYILERNGLDPDQDVVIEWKSEHAECVAALANDPGGVAMLPQPFVTTAQMQNEGIRVALDLTEEWEAAQSGSRWTTLVTGVLVVRTEFAQEHPEAVDAFLESYRASVDYVNANVAEAAQLVERYGIVKAAVAERAIPACKIVCIDGDVMSGLLSNYLIVLFDANHDSVGGALPDDGFYYDAA